MGYLGMIYEVVIGLEYDQGNEWLKEGWRTKSPKEQKTESIRKLIHMDTEIKIHDRSGIDMV